MVPAVRPNRCLKAALTQFPNVSVEIIMKQEIRTEQQIEEIMQEVATDKGFIVHTLVSETLREAMLQDLPDQ